MAENSGFISRWSKLKQAENKREPIIEKPVIHLDEADIASKLAALPDVNSLEQGFDITQFMHDYVPKELKNLALRKLWASESALTSHLCHALDYADDYNNPSSISGWGELAPDFNAREFAEKLFEKQPLIEGAKIENQSEVEQETAALAIDKLEPNEIKTLEQSPVIGAKKHGGAMPL